MPFDPTTWKPQVTYLPPTTPPEGGGEPRPPRVHIEVVIDARRPVAPPQPRRGLRLGLIGWIALFALIAGLAHGQPAQQWRSYQQGFTTQYQSNDGWTGHSYQQGNSRFYQFNGPDGRTQNCRSWKQGFQEFSECY